MERSMNLSVDEIQKITSYLDATTPLPKNSDLIFIPGTRLSTPAMIAADLFKRGIAPYIVVTGGENRYTGNNEAYAHQTILMQQGVYSDRVIVESRSTNTFENVTFALPLIQEKIDLMSLRSVLIIAKWMHSRRVLMTLKRHLPQLVRYYAHTYEPEGITRENWYQNPRAESANVLKNWENIPQYLEWEHIEEVTRDEDSYI
jgi:uncharacterized SAM-binding protein YcdF (DUF218 family)